MTAIIFAFQVSRTLTESDDEDSNDDDYNDDDYSPSRSLTESGDDDSNDDDDSGPTSATLSSESENGGNCRKRLRRRGTPATVTAGISTAKQCRPSLLRKGDNSVQCKNNLEQQNKLSDDEINKNVQNWLFGCRLYSKPTAWRLVQCKLCSTNFKTCKELRQHLKGHSDAVTLHSLDLTDNIVQYLFPNMINLDLIKESICKDIKKKQLFKYYAVLNEFSYEMSISDTEVEDLEEKILERVRQYKCVLCAQDFSYKYQMFTHLKQYHSKEEAPFKCDRCSLEFVSDQMYKQHLQTHCRNNDKGLLCGLCPGKFVWPENIKNHKCATKLLDPSPAAAPKNQEILEERSLKAFLRCCLCEQSFQKLRHLRQHMSLHADGKTSIDFKNCTYIKQFESSKPIDYEMLKQQIQNDFNRCQISRFYQAMDKYGNEMDISDSESESDSESRTEEVDGENVEDAYKCKLCKETFQKRKYVLMHQEERHNGMEMPFKCEVCNQQYVSVDLLLQHLKRECRNAYRQLGQQCEFCNVRFIWPNHLLKHKEMQHHLKAESSNSISSCGSLTLSETVTTTQPFNGISSCGSSASSETDKQSFKCSLCRKTFAKRPDLIIHKRLHKGKNVTKRSTCQKSFTTSSNTRQHMISHLGDYECDICGQKFLRDSYLKKHRRMKGHVPADGITLKNSITKAIREKPCSICGVYLSRNTNITRHMLTHTGEKPYKCDLCEMAFARRSNLKYHRRTHSKERPYKCPHCKRGFQLHHRLKKHILTHTGERPYQCTICKKSYITVRYLKRHMGYHTQEKTFKCEVCDKAFVYAAYLSKHRKSQGHYLKK